MKEEDEEEERVGGRWRLEGPRSKTPVYMTKKLPVPGSGEPVLPIIAAPRRPRDSPSSSYATRTSSDRPGPAWLDAPAAAATHRSSVTAVPHTRASPPPSPRRLSRPPLVLRNLGSRLQPLVLSFGALGSLFSSGLSERVPLVFFSSFSSGTSELILPSFLPLPPVLSHDRFTSSSRFLPFLIPQLFVSSFSFSHSRRSYTHTPA